MLLGEISHSNASPQLSATQLSGGVSDVPAICPKFGYYQLTYS